jgi:hypothetical protein
MGDPFMETDKISIVLSKAEGLVFFDWLSRSDSAESLPIEHPSEQTVLWVVEGQLEKQIKELFDPDYNNFVEAARREIKETH